MPKQIFINLPVRDLPKARAFYEAIGAVNNPQFFDDTESYMVVSDTIFRDAADIRQVGVVHPEAHCQRPA